ncbi:OX-2 membrane glycoprotein-like [Mantella aurantiaca]
MDWREGRFILACVLSYICMAVAVDESIQTEDVKAEFGESATLKCLLMKVNDLVQVTWKKIGKENETKLATYTTAGARVDKPYENRLNVSTAGLNMTAITIYKTGMEDEGCYACVFNVFPEGAKEGRVCLSITGEVLIEKNHQVKLGDAITLKCYLRNPEDIRQISWEKNGQNIGIYKNGATKMEPPFQNTMGLGMESRHVSALTIRKAAAGDAGEYKCVFNIFPKGSTDGTTILHVHGLASHLQPDITVPALTLILALLWL